MTQASKWSGTYCKPSALRQKMHFSRWDVAGSMAWVVSMSDSKDSTVIAPSVPQRSCDLSMVSVNGEHRFLWRFGSVCRQHTWFHQESSENSNQFFTYDILGASFRACKLAKLVTTCRNVLNPSTYDLVLNSTFSFSCWILPCVETWRTWNFKLKTKTQSNKLPISMFILKNNISSSMGM